MESKLAAVARLLRRIGEELPNSRSGCEAASENSSSSKQRRGADAHGRGTQLARVESLRDYVADVELSIRTRGACSSALHMYLISHRHLLRAARQDPSYAQAVVNLVNDIKEDALNQPVQAYDQIYLQAVETIALIYGKKASASSPARVLDEDSRPLVESRATELVYRSRQTDPATATSRAVANDERSTNASSLPALPGQPRSLGPHALTGILSGQPIPRGATSGLFSDAFHLDASDRARQLQSQKASTAASSVPGAAGHNLLPEFRKPKLPHQEAVFYPHHVGIDPRVPSDSKAENFPWIQMLDQNVAKSGDTGSRRPTTDSRALNLDPLRALGPFAAPGTADLVAKNFKPPTLVVEPGTSRQVARVKERLGNRAVAFGDEEIPAEDAAAFKKLGYSVPATWYPQRNKMSPAANFDPETHVHPWHLHSLAKSRPGAAGTSDRASVSEATELHPQVAQQQKRMAEIFGTSPPSHEDGALPSRPRPASVSNGATRSPRLEPLHRQIQLPKRSATTSDASLHHAPLRRLRPDPRFIEAVSAYASTQREDAPPSHPGLSPQHGALGATTVSSPTSQKLFSPSKAASAETAMVLESSKQQLAKFRDEMRKHKAKIAAIDAKQGNRIRALMDSMPLKFLLNYSVDAEYVRARCRAMLQPLFDYLNHFALAARFRRWKRNVEAVASASRFDDFKKAAALKKLAGFLDDAVREKNLRRKRRAMEQMKRVVAWYKYQLQLAAVLVLQRYVRGMLGRLFYQRMNLTRYSATRIQAIWRGFYPHWWWRVLKTAPPPIQAFWRGIYWKNLFPLLRAASPPIQTIWRGFFHRTRYRRARLAAVRIQTSLRRYWAQSGVLQKLRLVARNAQALRLWAVLEIQRFLRGRWARQQVFSIRAENERQRMILYNAALRVQRRYYARNGEFSTFALCCALRTSHEREIEEKRHEELLGRWWVTYRLQLKFRGMLRRKRTRARVQLHNAAILVQRNFRSHRQWAFTHELLARTRAAVWCQARHRKRAAARFDAARRIQVAYWFSSAKRAKRRVLLAAISIAIEKVVSRHLHKSEAATRLQAAFRAHFQFEWYRKYCAARTVAAASRGLLARHLLARMKLAIRLAASAKWLAHLFRECVPRVAPRVLAIRSAKASIIQSHVRRWILWRKVLHRRFLNARATDIQRAYAGLRGRRLFKYLLQRALFSKRNLFRRCRCVGDVLMRYRAKTRWLYDPADVSFGEGLGRYLRRFGHAALLCIDRLATIGRVRDVPKLQALTTSRALENAGIDDPEVARSMAELHSKIKESTDFKGPPASAARCSFQAVDIRSVDAVRAQNMVRERFPEASESFIANVSAAATSPGADVSVYALERVLRDATSERAAKDLLADAILWLDDSQSPVTSTAQSRQAAQSPQRHTSLGSQSFDDRWNRRRVRQFALLTEMALWRIVEVNAGVLVSASGRKAAHYEALDAGGGGTALRDLIQRADAAAQLREVANTASTTVSQMKPQGNVREQGRERLSRAQEMKEQKARAKSAKARLAVSKALAAAELEQREEAAKVAAQQLSELLQPAIEADLLARRLQSIFRGTMSRRLTDVLLQNDREQKRLQAEEKARQEAEAQAWAEEMERQRVADVEWYLGTICSVGWEERFDEYDGAYFYHPETGESRTMDNRPTYTVRQYDAAARVQRKLRLLLARRRVSRLRWEKLQAQRRAGREEEFRRTAPRRGHLFHLDMAVTNAIVKAGEGPGSEHAATAIIAGSEAFAHNARAVAPLLAMGPRDALTCFDFEYCAPVQQPPGQELVGQCIKIYRRHEVEDSAVERWFRDEAVKEAIDEIISRAFASATGTSQVVAAIPESAALPVASKIGWATVTATAKATKTLTAAQRRRVEARELRATFKRKLSAAAYVQGGVDFQQLFKHYDRDNSGELDLQEFISAMRRDAKLSSKDFSDAMLTKIFRSVDVDGSGEIDADEFIFWMEKDGASVSGAPETLKPGVALPFRSFFKRCQSAWATYFVENVFVSPRDFYGLSLEPPLELGRQSLQVAKDEAVTSLPSTKKKNNKKARKKKRKLSNVSSVADGTNNETSNLVSYASVAAEITTIDDVNSTSLDEPAELSIEQVRQNAFLQALCKETFPKGTDLTSICRGTRQASNDKSKRAEDHNQSDSAISFLESDDENGFGEGGDSEVRHSDELAHSSGEPSLMVIISGEYDVVEYRDAELTQYVGVMARFRTNPEDATRSVDARGHIVGDLTEFTKVKGEQLIESEVLACKVRTIASSTVEVVRIPLRALRAFYAPTARTEAEENHAAACKAAHEVDAAESAKLQARADQARLRLSRADLALAKAERRVTIAKARAATASREAAVAENDIAKAEAEADNAAKTAQAELIKAERRQDNDSEANDIMVDGSEAAQVAKVAASVAAKALKAYKTAKSTAALLEKKAEAAEAKLDIAQRAVHDAATEFKDADAKARYRFSYVPEQQAPEIAPRAMAETLARLVNLRHALVIHLANEAALSKAIAANPPPKSTATHSRSFAVPRDADPPVSPKSRVKSGGKADNGGGGKRRLSATCSESGGGSKSISKTNGAKLANTLTQTRKKRKSMSTLPASPADLLLHAVNVQLLRKAREELRLCREQLQLLGLPSFQLCSHTFIVGDPVKLLRKEKRRSLCTVAQVSSNSLLQVSPDRSNRRQSSTWDSAMSESTFAMAAEPEQASFSSAPGVIDNGKSAEQPGAEGAVAPPELLIKIPLDTPTPQFRRLRRVATEDDRLMVQGVVWDVVDSAADQSNLYHTSCREQVGELVLDIVKAAVDAAVSQSIEKVSQAKLAALQARWIPGVVVEFNDSDGYSRHLVSIRPERGEEIHFARRANRLVWFDLAATPYLIKHAHPVVAVQHLPNTFAPRFKWKMVPDDVYATEVYFWNSAIQESSWELPDYSFEEHEAATHLQRLFRGRSGRATFAQKARSQDVYHTILSVLRAARSAAWVGYGAEGLDFSTWLLRLGLLHTLQKFETHFTQVELDAAERQAIADKEDIGSSSGAEVIDNQAVKQTTTALHSQPRMSTAYKLSKTKAREVSVQNVSSVSPTSARKKSARRKRGWEHVATCRYMDVEFLMDKVGLEAEDARWLRRCTSSVASEEKALALVVSEDASLAFSPFGMPRSLGTGPRIEFGRFFSNQALREQGFVDNALASRTPIPLGAMQAFLRKYTGKAKTAVDMVPAELANRPYVSSTAGVAKCFLTLHCGLISCGRAFGLMRLKPLQDMAAEFRECFDSLAMRLKGLVPAVVRNDMPDAAAMKARANNRKAVFSDPAGTKPQIQLVQHGGYFLASDNTQLLKYHHCGWEAALVEIPAALSEADSVTDAAPNKGGGSIPHSQNDESAQTTTSPKFETMEGTCPVHVEMVFYAALELRRNFQHLRNLVEGFIFAQAVARGFLQRAKFRAYLAFKFTMATRIQTRWRMVLARKFRDRRHAMRYSPWEQCKDEEYDAYFYYNTETDETSWNEPPNDAPYKPFGWWPEPAVDEEPEEQVGLCTICNGRTATRHCPTCEIDYCFKCFVDEHAASRELLEHEFTPIILHQARQYLDCKQCGTFATRWIHVPAQPAQPEQPEHPDHHEGHGSGHAHSHGHGHGRAPGFGGPGSSTAPTRPQPNLKKLTNANHKKTGTFGHELLPGEPSCQACYEVTALKNWRTPLRYTEYRAAHPVCVQCNERFAHKKCSGCDGDVYCDGCFDEVHRKGRRRVHKFQLIRESLPPTVPSLAGLESRRKSGTGASRSNDAAVGASGQGGLANTTPEAAEAARKAVASTTAARAAAAKAAVGHKYCDDCDFGIARHACPWCHRVFCNGCNVVHPQSCAEHPDVESAVIQGAKVCFQCGEPAARQCRQCKRHFCDRRWFGNPGCFENYHHPTFAPHLRAHVWKPHPAKSIQAAVVKIQSNVRRYLVTTRIRRAKEDRSARLLQRVAQKWKLKRRGELIRLQRQEENRSLPSLFNKLVKTIKRAASKGEPKKSKRELVVEAVYDRWTLKDSAAKLNELVREEIVLAEVPEDRQDWLHTEVVRQIRKEVKKKLKQERIKRAGASAQKEQGRNRARSRMGPRPGGR